MEKILSQKQRQIQAMEQKVERETERKEAGIENKTHMHLLLNDQSIWKNFLLSLTMPCAFFID